MCILFYHESRKSEEFWDPPIFYNGVHDPPIKMSAMPTATLELLT